jgi:hypothetical protein
MSKKIKMPELKAEMPKAKKSSVNSVADALNLFTAGFSKKDVKSILNLTDNQIHHIYYNVFKENKQKGKVGRPKKVVDADVKIKTKKIGRPKKVAEVEVKPKSKRGRPKKVEVPPKKKMGRPKKVQEKTIDTWNPLDAYTKRTVIVGAENKDEIALEFLNSQVNSLKKQNQKLLEINNKHVLDLSKLKVELNNMTSEAEYEEAVKEYEELVNNLRNKHANQTNTINELQGVIANLTQEIKNLKEQDITSDELSKKQFEKSMGKKVLNFFISFMLGLIAAILFMIALA